MHGVLMLAPKHNNKPLRIYRQFSSSAPLLGPLGGGPPINFPDDHHITPGPLHLLWGNLTNSRPQTLSDTKAAHALSLKSSVIYSSVYAANNLIGAYSECGCVDQAFKVFDEIPLKNSATWNLMISGCNKNSFFDHSWELFCRMHSVGMDMDDFTYSAVVSACGSLRHVARGAQICGLVVKNGFFSDGYVMAGVIDFFAKCCMVDCALRVLYDTHCENIVCWNAVVSAAVKNNENFVALRVFRQICCHGSLAPNDFTLSSVLTACASVGELELGKNVHGRVIKVGFGANVFVGTAIVDLYSKCGAMNDAFKQFKLMPVRNVVSWTAIISGFARTGDSGSAVWVLGDMHKSGEEINSFTVSSVLAACANPAMLNETLQIHCWILKIGLCLDAVVKASLINTYSKVGAVNYSELAFTESEDLKQVGIWASMISAFVHSEIYEKALSLFQRMLKVGITPDKFSVSSIMGIIGSLTLGRHVHGYTIKVGLASDVSVGSSIFTMYSKCGNLEESLKAFDQLDKKDNVSWTSMIAGFTEHGCPDRSIQLFRMCFEESILDEKILACVLNACSALRSLSIGRESHGFCLRFGFNDHSIIDEALVNMYSKCGDLKSARIIFNAMPFKSRVTWSSLISGFSQNGQVEETLQLFHEMLSSNISIDAFTISSVVGALVNSCESRFGTPFHAYIIKIGLESESSVGSSLIMMYSRTGEIETCVEVFQKITDPDLVSFTTMIASYAHHSKGQEALQLFDLMKKSGIKPDGATFASVLSACSHAGLVQQGYFFLNSMIRDYEIEPGQKHYACMVDLLGRAGKLEEAERFIFNMPIEPDILVWETLLAACKVHGDRELGKMAAEKIMELRPNDAGAYISVSNICAEAGDWERVVGIRSSMREVGVRKNEPGWSVV
ncbi:Pentatricopeptide repeat-containing protein -chloroplastic [Striga hermonthica]|uniref:Pentatricopeptide repeat-containing protein -chloroplastic n=1 Tax=Striga hermonthica TaxID=68872 RepID=A0A9N7RQG4_STRHE|nr:Pentatricopeptide repeat-containing protein -chloroplastic [Striga hermonthica]